MALKVKFLKQQLNSPFSFHLHPLIMKVREWLCIPVLLEFKDNI